MGRQNKEKRFGNGREYVWDAGIIPFIDILFHVKKVHTFPAHFLFKMELWPIWGIDSVTITFLLKIISNFILFLGQIIRNCCFVDQTWS